MAKATVHEMQAGLRDQFLRLRMGSHYGEALRLVRESWAWMLATGSRFWGRTLHWHAHLEIVTTEAHNELSPDLMTTLDAHVDKTMAVAADRRPIMLEWWATLPAADRLLIEGYYLRPGDKVVGDMAAFTHLHLDLLHRFDREAPVPDARTPETDETDLARLTLQRAVGDFPDDRRAVLEALLIGEPGNQSFYARLTHAVAELEWRFGPQPDWDAPPPPRPQVRERLVSWAFVAGCGLAVASVIYAIIK